MNVIIACDENWGIGKDGHLLCHLPGDMKHFREMTMGKTVVMGRVTLESLPGGRGLTGRRNIVLTTQEDYQAEDAEVVHSFGELDEVLRDIPPDDIFVIGGAKIYSMMYLKCRHIYVTRIFAAFDADRHFVDLDQNSRYYVHDRSEIMEENGIKYQFVHYVKEPPEGGRR